MGKWNPDDAEDSIVTTKISSGRLNALLFIFNSFFISLGLLALSKDLNFTGNKLGEYSLEIWNGYTPALCWIAEPATHLFSIMRRFTIEPYTRIGFRFAFMFSGVIRIFTSYWRSHVLMYNALKKGKNSSIVFGIYKALPLVMGVQILLGGIMMTTSAHIDQYYMSNFSEIVTKAFFCITAFYMCLVVVCDWIEASGFWNYSDTSRYLIRVASCVLFISAFLPTLSDYSTYLQKILCHTNATTAFTAVTEYITILSLIIFHLTEHFDVPEVQLCIVEKKSL